MAASSINISRIIVVEGAIMVSKIIAVVVVASTDITSIANIISVHMRRDIAVIVVNNDYADDSGLIINPREIKEQESHGYLDFKGSLNSKFNNKYHVWSEIVISFNSKDKQNFTKDGIRNQNKTYLDDHMNGYGSSDHLVLNS